METVQTSVNIITLYPIAFRCVRCAFSSSVVSSDGGRRRAEWSGENQFNCVMFLCCCLYNFFLSNIPLPSGGFLLSLGSKKSRRVVVCAAKKKAAEKSTGKYTTWACPCFSRCFSLSLDSAHRHRYRSAHAGVRRRRSRARNITFRFAPLALTRRKTRGHGFSSLSQAMFASALNTCRKLGETHVF
jgi:hypothetical protein